MSRRTLENGCAIILVGLLAGVAGLSTILLLRAVEHFTYDYSFGALLAGVAGSSPARRALGPLVGGALAGFGWWMLRQQADVPSLAEAISDQRRIPRLSLSIDAGIQVFLVGSGASLGREAAPRQLAVALGDLMTSRWSLTPRDREILLACAAGAGLAAVYSAPVSGALFTIQIMLKSWHPRVVITAVVTSGLAVAVASPVTHVVPPLNWPDLQVSHKLIAFAVVLAPLALGTGLLFNRLMELARTATAVKSWQLIPAIAAAGLLIGIFSVWWPELPGNGKSILTVSVNSGLTLGSAAVIFFLKPLLTSVYLRAGAVGGMITPALATGAAMGSIVTLALNTWTSSTVSVPAASLMCAAGVLAVTQRAPLWAAVFVWELARPPLWLLVSFLAVAAAAHGLRRIYEHRRRASIE